MNKTEFSLARKGGIYPSAPALALKDEINKPASVFALLAGL
jgi:hypothetical protein